MSLIQNLRDVPLIGVISLVDEQSKSVYVMFSGSLYTILCATIHKLKLKTQDNKALREAFDNDRLTYNVHTSYDVDPGGIALRTEYARIVSNYLACGYTDMRSGYIAIGYKVKRYVLRDFRSTGPNAFPLAYVCGTARNHADLVLGIFVSAILADEWIAATYGTSLSSAIPVFADNDLTREYHNTKGFNIKRGR